MSTNGRGTLVLLFFYIYTVLYILLLEKEFGIFGDSHSGSFSFILNANLFAWVVFQMSEIKNELDTLPLRAMLAAAFITYLSAAPEDRRRQCLEVWTVQSGLQSRNFYINS